jgi:hypothetical protein
LRVETGELLSHHSGVKLKADLVDDAEADQCGQRKADTDREKINVDGQPVSRMRLQRAASVGVCHLTPEWLCFLFGLPADLEWAQ